VGLIFSFVLLLEGKGIVTALLLATAALLGSALMNDQQIEKGQVLIDRILRAGDSAEARLMMGVGRLRVRDFPGALEELQKALALNPKLPLAYSRDRSSSRSDLRMSSISRLIFFTAVNDGSPCSSRYVFTRFLM
jgi:hypothetical protein